jgi:hypothetical protein
MTIFIGRLPLIAYSPLTDEGLELYHSPAPRVSDQISHQRFRIEDLA